jgi:hypothetical protein
MQKHSEESEAFTVFSPCNITYYWVRVTDCLHELSRHIRREHLKHLYCSQCFKRFGNKFERDRHTKLERACERSRAKPEAPVPRYVIELASKFNACKFQDWNNLLFKNGKPIYDYQGKLP